MIQKAGMYTRMEERVYLKMDPTKRKHARDARRLDITVEKLKIAIDVTIINPLAHKHSSADPSSIAEKNKHQWYADIKETGYTLNVAAVETQGKWGFEMKDLVNRMCNRIVDNKGTYSNSVQRGIMLSKEIKFWEKRISVLVQRELSRMNLIGIRKHIQRINNMQTNERD